MFLTPKLSLAEKIIFILGKHPGSSAGEIWKLAGQGIYSIQAVYKELRLMQRHGVVVKVGLVYSLRLSYLFALSENFESFQSIYLKHGLPEEVLFGPQKQTWQINSLIKLINFWDYVLVGLVNASRTKQLFGFTRHAWYHLAQPEAEDRYYKAVRKTGGRIYLVLGAKHALNVWSEQYWPRDIVEYGYSKSCLGFEPSLEIDVIDDYILTVKKDKHTTANIERLYASAEFPGQIHNLPEIFLHPARIRIVLERNSRKAELLKKRFGRFFGLSLQGIK